MKLSRFASNVGGMRREVLAGAVGLALVAVPVTGAAAALGYRSVTHAVATTVTYFAGIPGASTDFYSDGQRLATGVKPGTSSQTFALKPGTHNLSVYRAGVDPESAAPLIAARTTVTANTNNTVAAFLSASGDKTLKSFSNAFSASSKPRLVVRHLAEAETLDISVNGNSVMQNLRNGVSASAILAPGQAAVAGVAAGTSNAQGSSVSVDLTARATTTVLLWGSRDDVRATELKPATRAIPSKVPAGEGDLTANRWSAYGLLISGLGAVGATVWMLRRRTA